MRAGGALPCSLDRVTTIDLGRHRLPAKAEDEIDRFRAARIEARRGFGLCIDQRWNLRRLVADQRGCLQHGLRHLQQVDAVIGRNLSRANCNQEEKVTAATAIFISAHH